MWLSGSNMSLSADVELVLDLGHVFVVLELCGSG